jgi:hypothetical protein
MATPHIIALAALVILAQYNPAGPNGPWAPRQYAPVPNTTGHWMPPTLPPGSPGITIPDPTPPAPPLGWRR